MNAIRGLIEEIPKFRADQRQHCKKLKSKDRFVNGAIIKGPD